MLKDIIESKQESALLTFLLLAPKRSFGTLELSKRLNIKRGALISILNNFINAGQVRSFSKRGIKYYMLNPLHEVFPELKQSLLKNQARYEDELFLAVKRLGNIRAAFLSGLFTGYPELPVDILLVGKINLTKLSVFLADCKKMIGQEINYSIMSEEEFIQRRDTFDRFIKDIFDYRHLVVVDNISHNKKRK